MGIDPEKLDLETLSEDTITLYHIIAERRGEDTAREIICDLIELGGGYRYYISAAMPIAEQQARTAAIIMLEKGRPAQEVARETGLHLRLVRQMERGVR